MGGVDEVFKAGVGVGGIELGSVGEIGVGGSPGNIPGGVIGGVGVESNDNHGGKGRRIEAGRRNGGIGVDSSEEKGGTKDIAGEGFGGVVSWKERSDLVTEYDYDGLQGRFCGGGGSHIDIFLTSDMLTRIDVDF